MAGLSHKLATAQGITCLILLICSFLSKKHWKAKSGARLPWLANYSSIPKDGWPESLECVPQKQAAVNIPPAVAPLEGRTISRHLRGRANKANLVAQKRYVTNFFEQAGRCTPSNLVCTAPY